eukprot:CAMPEP_0171774426 /NCGR_PEP_ID=MMETSP0991-20121206/55879_1 /TAXON_ID=483369 /ORGANISM="non described non described, Strain CCMP2098" /LENGTH=63 /DNA_ID=CAMNT_0012380347 /DNA_START=53 /DNA_END=240 /DNA_ORIENTATION=-
MTGAERASYRRESEEAAKVKKEAQETAAKAEKLAIKERAAKRELEEKRRARTLLRLEGYWRPS